MDQSSLEKEAFCVEYFYAKPGCREKLIAALVKLVGPTTSEPGCLQYDLIQDNNNQDLIILLVKFQNKKLMQKHENQEYIKSFAENEMQKYCEKLVWNDGQAI